MSENLKKTLLALTCLAVGLDAVALDVTPPDAGALLNQSKKNLDAQFNTIPLTSSSFEYEVFNGFEYKNLSVEQVAFANKLTASFVGKKLIIAGLVQELEREFQDRNEPYVFLLTREDGKVILSATKVNLGKIVVTNQSRFKSLRIQGIASYGLKEGDPVNRRQLERNTTVLREVPGIINQYGMVPGATEGETDLMIKTVDGPMYSGSLTVDNSSTKSLGVIAGKMDLQLHNLTGHGDQVRIFALDTEHSNSESGDGSIIISDSGAQLGVNVSRFSYRYKTNSETLTSSYLNEQESRYKGTSVDYGIYLNFPTVRNEFARQTITFNADHVYNLSNSYITLDSTPVVSTAKYVSQYAALPLSYVHENKVGLGVSGINSLPMQLIANYQANLTGGKTNQSITSLATLDKNSAQQYGEFAKLTASTSLNRAVDIFGSRFSITASGLAQLTNKNLASLEKAYVGGNTQMKAWAPQVLGADQLMYGQFQLDKQLALNMSLGIFIEGAFSEQNRKAYRATTGQIDNGKNTMSDAGVSLFYQPAENVELTGSIASKLSKNPKINGIQLDDKSSVRGWVSGTLRF